MTEYLDNVCTYNYTERQGDGGMRKEQMKYSQSREAKYVIFGRTQRNILKEDLEGRGEGLGRKKRGSAFQVGRTTEATIALKQQV